MEGHAFRLHLRDAARDNVLLHLEIGDAVSQPPASLGELLKHVHVVAGARQLLRAGQSSRTRADDCHFLSGPVRGRLRFHPTALEGAIGNRAFDGFDGDGIVVDVERAGGLAGRRADAAGDLGEIVGGVEVARSLLPVAAIDEVVPVRDLIVDRTAGVTVGNAAIHAACRLFLVFLLRQRAHEFAPMLDALLDRLVVAVLALVFQEAGDLAHSHSAEGSYSAASTICARCSSASARRYSTGITLRNIGQYFFQSARILSATVEPVKRAWRVIRRVRRSRSCCVMSPMTSTRPCEPRSWVWW